MKVNPLTPPRGDFGNYIYQGWAQIELKAVNSGNYLNLKFRNVKTLKINSFCFSVYWEVTENERNYLILLNCLLPELAAFNSTLVHRLSQCSVFCVDSVCGVRRDRSNIGNNVNSLLFSSQDRGLCLGSQPGPVRLPGYADPPSLYTLPALLSQLGAGRYAHRPYISRR